MFSLRLKWGVRNSFQVSRIRKLSFGGSRGKVARKKRRGAVNKWLCIALMLMSTAVCAKKLYKYQDADGKWHFTDKAPADGQSAEVRQLKAEPKRYVWLEKTSNANRPEFFVLNNYQGMIEVEISLSRQDNASTVPTLPQRFVVAPGRSPMLFTAMAIDNRKPWGFEANYKYMIGEPLPDYQNNALYQPPLAGGGRHQVSQAAGGEFSHSDPENYYAVDIAMPEGTPVHAARSGVVLEVNNDYFGNSTEQAYKSRANSIRVLHDDGSMAVYAHLALEKAQTYPGMKVKAGQLLGYSGNTGYSTGPHLHFAVQINTGMALKSIPVTFVRADGTRFEAKVGDWLEGYRAP
jgi:murein DD-endopeptidase MepM/ murein hydrolase activator NlpD